MIRIFGILSCLIVSGCAVKLPPLDHVKPDEISRVGILVDVTDNPRHTHIGTTIFNNFEKGLPYYWELNDTIVSQLTECASSRGLSLVPLDARDYSREDIRELIEVKGESWRFKPEGANLRSQLIQGHDLDAIIVIDEVNLGVMYPYEVNHATGYGLFTRGVFGSVTYIAYHHLMPFIYYLRQPGWLGVMSTLDPPIEYSTPLPRFRDVSNIKRVTDAELKPVRDAIEAYVSEMARVTCDNLPER